MQRALVEQAKRGDREAFDALARMAADRCMAIAFRILRDADRADDAVQAALISAWRQLRTLRDPEALSPDASDTCSDPLQGIDRFEEIMIGMSPADFSASVTPDGGVRVYLLDVEDRVLAAMVTHGHGDGDQREFLASAQQVIDSFAF